MKSCICFSSEMLFSFWAPTCIYQAMLLRLLEATQFSWGNNPLCDWCLHPKTMNHHQTQRTTFWTQWHLKDAFWNSFLKLSLLQATIQALVVFPPTSLAVFLSFLPGLLKWSSISLKFTIATATYIPYLQRDRCLSQAPGPYLFGLLRQKSLPEWPISTSNSVNKNGMHYSHPSVSPNLFST